MGKGSSLLIALGLVGLVVTCPSKEPKRAEKGADWLVVQHDTTGNLATCWALRNTSINNHPMGIYWKTDSKPVFVSDDYSKIRVYDGDWQSAAKAVHVSLEQCIGGKYTP